MTPLQFYLAALHTGEQRTSGKSLALPTGGQPPTFDQVLQIVLTGVMCRFSVGVMCLTQAALDDWLDWPGRYSSAMARFDLLDCDQATLRDWQAFLGSHSYDMIVLHGACAELPAGRLSVRYVTALVDAAPTGTVVLA